MNTVVKVPSVAWGTLRGCEANFVLMQKWQFLLLGCIFERRQRNSQAWAKIWEGGAVEDSATSACLWGASQGGRSR